MNKDTIMTRVAAILSTLNETDGSPESMLYIFCDMNMQDWQTIRHILVESKWITISAHYVTLTEAGKEIAAKIDAALTTKG